MGFFDFLKPKQKEIDEPNTAVKRGSISANVYGPSSAMAATQGVVYAIYDGEMGLGEMGPPKEYQKDFYILRVRSRQLYLESPICQIVVNRFTQWVIGPSLKLKAEPQIEVLKSEKINIDTELFNKSVENLFKVYTHSKLADYAGQQSLDALMEEAHREGKIAGDMLVVLRVVGGLAKVQHIDSSHVGNPPNCSITNNADKLEGSPAYNGYDYVYQPTGNRIRLGVEIDKTGNHVAYHVRVGITLNYVRVPARDSNGMVRAYMIYGFKPEIDSTRGTPLISVVMETAKKLERYNSAALAAAEETANLPFFFEHGVNSDNEDPLSGRRAKGLIAQPTAGGAAATDIGVDVAGNKIAADTAVSTKRTVINLPNDVTIKTPDTKREYYVKDFSMFHVDIICAAVNMPPNVAMSKYEDSFSASRMAGKDWEHTFMTERADFSQQYLNPIYALQMYLWVLNNKVQAPGFLEALFSKNMMAVEAYLYNRWVGAMFPDIDPLKTIKYIREALGVAFEHVPIMTAEAAAELIDQGDILAVIKQAGEELKATSTAGIELPDQDVIAPDAADGEKEGQTKRKPSSGGSS